jgi:hypothetical protein
MTPDIQRTVEAMGPAFALPLHALTAIEAQHGRAAAINHALASDAVTRIVMLMLEDTKLALVLMRELVEAQQTGKQTKVGRRCQRRISKALDAAKARADLASDKTPMGSGVKLPAQ